MHSTQKVRNPVNNAFQGHGHSKACLNAFKSCSPSSADSPALRFLRPWISITLSHSQKTFHFVISTFRRSLLFKRINWVGKVRSFLNRLFSTSWQIGFCNCFWNLSFRLITSADPGGLLLSFPAEIISGMTM